MSIKPFCHYSMENNPTIFDEEALTALQLAARTAGKVNEVIHGFNELEENVPKQIAEDVNKHIENGDFDRAIGEFLGDLDSRVNNLLGSISEGSTTMDAEVIDGRLGEDGKKYGNIGEAIRSQFRKSIRAVTHSFTDANDMREAGFYFKGGSDTWANVPESMTAGVIITFAPDAAMYPSRVVQLAIEYTGNMYVRNMAGSAFTNWRVYAAANAAMTRKTTVDGQTYDADKLTESGYYHIGSTQTALNTPTDFGMLIVYQGHLATQVYQMWIDHATSGVYVRDMKYAVNGSTFRPWVKLLTAEDVPAAPVVTEGSNFVYKVVKQDGENFFIYKKGANGYIRYTYGYDSDTLINLGTYRLKKIEHVDDAFNLIHVITDTGADVEGVLLLSEEGGGAAEADHVGGVHGDEQATDHKIFIDGKLYTMATVPNIECNEIRVFVDSDIYHCDSDELACTKYKQTVFDREGVHVHMRYTHDVVCWVKSARVGMFSIEKDNITHYVCMDDIDFHSDLYNVPPTTTTSKKLCTLYGNEVSFLGDVRVRHWCDFDFDSDDTLKTGVDNFLHDYGDRLKSYFTLCNDSSFELGYPLIAVNHFKIDC